MLLFIVKERLIRPMERPPTDWGGKHGGIANIHCLILRLSGDFWRFTHRQHCASAGIGAHGVPRDSAVGSRVRWADIGYPEKLICFTGIFTGLSYSVTLT